jgi:hypothetical protein
MDSGFACCVGSQARLSTRAAGYNITSARGAFYRGKFALFFTFFFPPKYVYDDFEAFGFSRPTTTVERL